MNEENQTKYNDLISKTFCENAIRTVMMVDDEYISYSQLITDLADKNKSEDDFKKTITDCVPAADMKRFFEEKKLICDISNGREDFDPEHIRKSDLVILDYELEKHNSKPSLEILKSLANTPHMNLVVVHTNQNLNKAWLEVSSSLLGISSSIDELTDVSLKDYLLSETDEGEAVPDNWNIFTEEHLAGYLLGETDRGLRASLVEKIDTSFKNHLEVIVGCLLSILSSKYDQLQNKPMDLDIEGEFSGNQWLKLGNVFIVFHSKSADGAAGIWSSLESALHNWQPNYFRLIASEIQNQIENGGVVLSSYSETEKHSQAAWLWQLLKDTSNSELVIKDLLENNSDVFIEKLILSKETIEFTNSLISLFNGFPSDDLESKQIQFSMEQVSKNSKPSGSLRETVLHSLNYSFSMKEFNSPFITTGTILKSEDEKKWFLCVSPSCDTIPTQNNTDLSKRLEPEFKFLKFVVLTEIKIKKALESATDGRFFFLKDSLTLQMERPSNIEYGICTNRHINDESFDVSFMDKGGNQLAFLLKKLKVVSQLKNSYAARFQSEISHHLGRIGVDYISMANE